MIDIMLDLETWGTRPGCAIRSIGAVSFDREARVVAGAKFYVNVDHESCLMAGLHQEPETVRWWSEQSLEAQDALVVEPIPLLLSMQRFHAFFRSCGGVYLWCHGANFDEPIWSAACAALGRQVPWKFWNVRCTRTTYDLCDFDPKQVERAGTYHNALDDARHQVRCVQLALAKRRDP